MEQTKSRSLHTGWREDEIDRLWDEIRRANESGQPLRSVFEQMGETLGRKPNSVRNYYYMQLRSRDSANVRRAAPFETFSEAEVRSLVKEVLRARAQGQSVRACVMALSQGDHTRMLRYQNKYRSVLKKRPELVEELCEELRREGVACKSPLEENEKDMEQLRGRIADRAGSLGDPEVLAFLQGLNRLLERAQDHDPQLHGDRLRVQRDMAMLRYDDLSRTAGELLLTLKEYLGQEEEKRVRLLPEFCAGLAQQVTAMENAMQ